MKFSTFIIIALLALIAYALLRPASSPNTVQEVWHLARQLIAKAGEKEFRLPEDMPFAAPKSGEKSAQPGTEQPLPMPKSETPGNGKPSSALPRLTWDPLTKGEDAGERKQYTGWVRQRLIGGCLLLRSGTKSKPDSGSEGDYMLTGYPGAAEAPLDSQIDFYAYSGGVVTYESDTLTEIISILVYSSAAEPKNEQGTPSPQIVRNTPPPENAQPPRPGSWMWDRKSALDRGAYNQK